MASNAAPTFALTLAVTCYFVAKRNNYARLQASTWPERWTALKEAAPSMLLPTVIIGGIYSGVFTPTEGAIAACMWAMVLGLVWYRTLSFKSDWVYRSYI